MKWECPECGWTGRQEDDQCPNCGGTMKEADLDDFALDGMRTLFQIGAVQHGEDIAQNSKCKHDLDSKLQRCLALLNTSRRAFAACGAVSLRIVPSRPNRRAGEFLTALLSHVLRFAGAALGAATNTARDTVFPTLNGASVVVGCVPWPNTSQSSSPFGDTSVADPSRLIGREGVGGVRVARVRVPVPFLPPPCLLLLP